MSGNSRHRRVYHNTYGDNVPNNENKDQFPNQGSDPFSNTSNVSNLAFQSQSSLQYSTGSNSTFGSGRNSNIGENTFVDKPASSSRAFASSSSAVSSPFLKNSPTHANTATSPFQTSTFVSPPNLNTNYPFPATTGTPVASGTPLTQTGINQPYGAGYNSYGTEQANLGVSSLGVVNVGVSNVSGFTNVPSPNLDLPGTNVGTFPGSGFGNVPSPPFGSAPNLTVGLNTGLNTNLNPSINTSTNFSNQSQPQDRSQLYLDGQLVDNPYPNQVTQPVPTTLNPNAGGFNQNTNAVFPNTNVNFNTVNLSTLNRTSSNFAQPHTQIQGHTMGQQQGFDQNNFPLPSQLGAQLTKFGEIYNQRLQQSESDNEVDPPLLDELGINMVDIYNHLVSVMVPKKGNQTFLNYEDLYGPLLTFVTFAVALMFSGKICFSIIYVLFVFCNVGIYMLFNLINDTYITFSKTVTILGYSLLPLCVTPLFGFLSRFIKVVPVVMVYFFVAWSTVSAAYLFQVELNLKGRFYFIMYPILLYYTTFANIVVF